MTVTPVRVWLPVLVTVTVKSMVSPASARPGGATTVSSRTAVFSTARAGVRTAVTVASSGAEVTGLPSKVAVATAVLVTEPASRSAWVMV